MMNIRYEKFVRAYLRTNNITKSAISAGYSPKTAAFQGSRLLKNVKVKQAVESARKHAEGRACMTREQWLARLDTMAKKREPRIALDSMRELGKAMGWYEPEKHSIGGSILVIE